MQHDCGCVRRHATWRGRHRSSAGETRLRIFLRAMFSPSLIAVLDGHTLNSTTEGQAKTGSAMSTCRDAPSPHDPVSSLPVPNGDRHRVTTMAMASRRGHRHDLDSLQKISLTPASAETPSAIRTCPARSVPGPGMFAFHGRVPIAFSHLTCDLIARHGVAWL